VSARHEGVDECAEVVAGLLRSRGFEAEVQATGGHPVVLADAGDATAGRTLLFYNHYDVQPPEPLELWESPPFDLTQRDGAVFARGSKDDKGEFVARLASLDALAKAGGGYPCRLTWLAEGEEEVGSPHLPEWVEKHRHDLAVDGAIWEEGGIDRLLLDRRGIDVVAATFDPTCNIAGIGGGYQGPGSKTVIPSRATCKVDFRLVPEQDPYDIETKLRRHLDQEGFEAVE